MRLNIFLTQLLVSVITLTGCGGGGGSAGGGTVIQDVNDTSPRPLVIIRIEFNDYPFTSPASTWSQKIFGTNEGQLNDYYNEISYGKFHFQKANETDGTADGIITVQLNENHPGFLEDNIDKLADAAVLADASIDFSQYDTDQNGAISSDELQIMFLVAGGERATGANPGIWAHAWCMLEAFTNAPAPTLDTVTLMSCNDEGGYSAFGEKHFDARIGNDATIGVIAHELGHAVFALPDLYDTDGSSSGIGNFGLMGGGNWAYKDGDKYVGTTPVHMTGWSKVYSGFVTSTIMESNIIDLDVNATSAIEYNLYQIPTGRTGEYFLVENRAASGYDRGLYSLQGLDSFEGGLSILHIDDNLLSTCITSNSCNDNELHKLVDVEEANNDLELDNNSTYEGHYKNLFYSANNDSFTPATLPNTKRYDGGDSGVSITNISNPDATMKIDIEIN
ncbi:MAG: M6 family metalloprotease domain-containing protein [Sulfurovum sp.]|uniref:M6 family metalloprotease domain-containing protein n=1 Tax=Sulfurovum sp. TaxID=1969726 RepID=UPI0028683222|nr:M6 family metalloprotease domain-containing protein [Sulfurovum sp.]MCO4844968.1 M6 family metalloprotease domain-containing protein [Sulfurovum sp.]